MSIESWRPSHQLRESTAGRIATLVTSLLIAAGFVPPLRAQAARVTIFAPEPVQYEIAFDELELAPLAGADSSRLQNMVDVSGARLIRRKSDSALFQTATASTDALVSVARTLESVNPGTRADVVVYLADRPHTEVTRRVVTREVAVILKPDANASAFTREHRMHASRSFPGLSHAFLLTAEDSFSAIELANALRNRPDVEHAYPLLRQQQFAR